MLIIIVVGVVDTILPYNLALTAADVSYTAVAAAVRVSIYGSRVDSTRRASVILIKFNGRTRVIYCLPKRGARPPGRTFHVIVIMATTRELI